MEEKHLTYEKKIEKLNEILYNFDYFNFYNFIIENISNIEVDLYSKIVVKFINNELVLYEDNINYDNFYKIFYLACEYNLINGLSERVFIRILNNFDNKYESIIINKIIKKNISFDFEHKTTALLILKREMFEKTKINVEFIKEKLKLNFINIIINSLYEEKNYFDINYFLNLIDINEFIFNEYNEINKNIFFFNNYDVINKINSSILSLNSQLKLIKKILLFISVEKDINIGILLFNNYKNIFMNNIHFLKHEIDSYKIELNEGFINTLRANRFNNKLNLEVNNKVENKKKLNKI